MPVTRGIKTDGGDCRLHPCRATHRFLRQMDAANVDLKAFTDEFWRQTDRLAPAAGAETATIPAARNRCLVRNHHAADSGPERFGCRLHAMCEWIAEHLGGCAAAFHRLPPGLQAGERAATPAATLAGPAGSHAAGTAHVYTRQCGPAGRRHHSLPPATIADRARLAPDHRLINWADGRAPAAADYRPFRCRPGSFDADGFRCVCADRASHTINSPLQCRGNGARKCDQHDPVQRRALCKRCCQYLQCNAKPGPAGSRTPTKWPEKASAADP